MEELINRRPGYRAGSFYGGPEESNQTQIIMSRITANIFVVRILSPPTKDKKDESKINEGSENRLNNYQAP